MSYYDSNTHIMPEGLGCFRNPDEIRAYFSESIGAVELEVVNDLEEIEVNGTWAYLIGLFAAKVTPKNGGASEVIGRRYLILLRKDPDGAWRVLCGHRQLHHRHGASVCKAQERGLITPVHETNGAPALSPWGRMQG